MKFPDSKLYSPEPSGAGPIATPLLEIDPDRPHRYRPSTARGVYGGCDVCGGSARTPIHYEPIGGWPQ